MATEITLNFRTEDEGLNLTGSVNFPERMELTVSEITIRGLADWRHVPANIVHVNERMITNFRMPEQSAKFAKVGMNWIGLKANTDLLISHAVRTGRNGTKKVQEQLTKFFKTLGASSIKFSVLDTGRAYVEENAGDNENPGSDS